MKSPGFTNDSITSRTTYYTALLAESDSAVLEKYKEIVENEFFPAQGLGDCRIEVVKKAIADYKKISGSPEGLVDIMLHFVKLGSDYADEYQWGDEELYEDLVGTYEKALKLIRDNGLTEKFKKRCAQIVEEATDAYK